MDEGREGKMGGIREIRRRKGGTEEGKEEEREGRWTPQFLRCGCASDYSWKGQSDKAAHKVG